ncbi:prophage tail fiber N-terminal domain-containing protein, partial [Serratia fonticola]|uniref:phage tail fiber protein n=1 Tax=Serratia fonticola TaxID=47917 RepID=UPI003AAA562B
MTVFPGEYEVTVSTLGHVGDIRVLTDSVNGTLNDFLISPPKPEELTPEVVRTVDTMRAETAASAAAAKVSETNAAAVTGVLNSSPGGATAEIVWRRIGKITNFGQGGKTLVITIGGTAQYNGRTSTNGLNQIVIRSGSGGVTAINASGRASVSAYITNGTGTANSSQLINDIGLIETSANTYEVYIKYNPYIGDISASIAGVSMSDLISNWKWDKTIVDNPNIVLEREVVKVWTEGSLPNPMKAGDYGLGSPYTPTVTDLSAQLTNQWWHTSGIATAPNTGLWAGISGGYDAVSRWNMAFLQGGTTVDFRVQVVKSGTAGAWATVWHTLNTTVDANGFIKKASPIVKLFGNGQCELNDESQGVTTERISVGVYRVSGVLGFNGDGAWGGAGNGIEIPVDDNKRPLIWVESKVLPDGDIEIRTYHRTYAT